MILPDTYALVWMDAGSGKLGLQARSRIDTAPGEDVLAVSVISFQEPGMLQIKKRIAMPPLIHWRRELLKMGLQELPMNGSQGILTNELDNFHPDPADRLIVAAAMVHNALLVTADRRIPKWPGKVGRIEAGR
ncbi:MAG TPA: type II toxin-antitoxin system VapC family toxin [Gammaproteobacteria bacterium]|nr:type II toxin-antitoxin system VapC family toxin [Gammaproteobacteria bacterium]